MIISDKDRFLKGDKGGAIYTVPSEGFSYDEDVGMGAFEWTSTEPVNTAKKLEFDSALTAMKHSGVRVFFLASLQFQSFIKKSGEEKIAWLSHLR